MRTFFSEFNITYTNQKVSVEIKATYDRSGIGFYEYFGHQGYDDGSIIIEHWQLVSHNSTFSDSEIETYLETLDNFDELMIKHSDLNSVA